IDARQRSEPNRQHGFLTLYGARRRKHGRPIARAVRNDNIGEGKAAIGLVWKIEAIFLPLIIERSCSLSFSTEGHSGAEGAMGAGGSTRAESGWARSPPGAQRKANRHNEPGRHAIGAYRFNQDFIAIFPRSRSERGTCFAACPSPGSNGSHLNRRPKTT